MSYQAIDESTFENALIHQFDNLIKEQLLSRYAEEISVIDEDIKEYEEILKSLESKPSQSKSIKAKKEKTIKHLRLALQQKNEICELALEESRKANAGVQENETKEAYLVRTGKLDPIAASKEEFTIGKNSVNSFASHSQASLLSPRNQKLKDLSSGEQKIDSKYSSGSTSPLPSQTKKLKIQMEDEVEVDIDESLNILPDEDRSCSFLYDDSEDKNYQNRLNTWRMRSGEESTVNATKDLVHIDKQFGLPLFVWEKLFNYQKTGVRWLWELHKQNIGGIIADEMGLGKTIQVISFLSGLNVSSVWMGPVLILCPATVLQQWAMEINLWWPPLRVIIYHNSNKFFDKPRKFLQAVFQKADIILSSYSIFQIYRDQLLEKDWFYIFLDEGHKIRNPNTDIADVLKKITTSHRIIITGTPIQNNLVELWSLFDFVYPGRLGTLPIFQSQFALPINMGGFVHAGPLQIQTSYKCACILRDLVSPYMLRRWKRDVATDLPNKEEQVVLCMITPFQRKIYEEFLESGHVHSILRGATNMLYGIDILRKICNHPFLLKSGSEWKAWMESKSLRLSESELSGKLNVLKDLLRSWKIENHKVLIFSQTKIMLDILEGVMNKEAFTFLRMDGGTDVSQRLRNIEQFNSNPDIFVFLLTTRVGGIGVNLTGADRIIIYDPDWNPSTDLQARERAWRYGQKNDVTILRLVTRGTIEEKIYHRQIFKQVLTNRILQNPKSSRFFKASDLHDLFTLAPENVDLSETDANFIGTKLELKEKSANRPLSKPRETEEKSSAEAGTDPTELLSYVLNVAGVHSAHAHDDILQSCDTPDVVLLQREAEKIALRSAQLLKESSFHRRQYESPTEPWQSRPSGTQVLSIESHFDPLNKQPLKSLGSVSLDTASHSSSSILENLRAKSSPSAASPNSQIITNDTQLHPLAKSIYQYLKARGGKASTDDILEYFKSKISREDIILFKKLLKSIARLEKDQESSARYWLLKPLAEEE